MMYTLAAGTGFRKGEIGSLTKRSVNLDADPPTATVEASFSKRRRQDTQVLHAELVCPAASVACDQGASGPDDAAVSRLGRIAGGVDRKTHKMIRVELEAARESGSRRRRRKKSERNGKRRTSSPTGITPGCTPIFTVAGISSSRIWRSGNPTESGSDAGSTFGRRLTLGVYTHADLSDQTAAIAAMPGPPGV